MVAINACEFIYNYMGQVMILWTTDHDINITVMMPRYILVWKYVWYICDQDILFDTLLYFMRKFAWESLLEGVFDMMMFERGLVKS